MSYRLLVITLMLGLSTAALAESASRADQRKAAKAFNKAEKSYNLQEYESALQDYREAYLLSSAPDLLFNIGQCYRQLGRYDEAVKSYRAFLKEAPTSPQANEVEAQIKRLEFLLANSLTKEGLEKAAQLFEQAETSYRLQKYEEALPSYEESYKLSKEAQILFNIGQCYRKLDKLPEAVASYRAFLRDDPGAAKETNTEALIAELEQQQAASTQPSTAPIKAEPPKEKPLTPAPKFQALEKPTQQPQPKGFSLEKPHNIAYLIALGGAATWLTTGIIGIAAAPDSQLESSSKQLARSAFTVMLISGATGRILQNRDMRRSFQTKNY